MLELPRKQLVRSRRFGSDTTQLLDDGALGQYFFRFWVWGRAEDPKKLPSEWPTR